MSDDKLGERGRTLEEEFFRKEEQKKLQALKDKLAGEDAISALRKASGLTDEKLLARLVELGLKADAVAAIALIPLVHVAWADGDVQAAERQAILSGAKDKGVEVGTAAHELLSSWLDKAPRASLFVAWQDYIGALRPNLSETELAALRAQVLDFSRAVAMSAGGVMGLGKVSGPEKKAIEAIAAALAD